jgi:hypothetical protein
MTSDAIESTRHAESFDLLAMDRRIGQRVVRRRVAKLAAWSGLVALGITRGGVLGWLGSGIGFFGVAAEVVDWFESRPEWRKAAVRGHFPGQRLLKTSRVNVVDHTSATSFPASDSPAPHET